MRQDSAFKRAFILLLIVLLPLLIAAGIQAQPVAAQTEKTETKDEKTKIQEEKSAKN